MNISRNILIILFSLFAVSMIAIGRFYDSRLVVYGVNISVIISTLYSVFAISSILLFQKTPISVYKLIRFLFYSSIIISTLFLWPIYGITDYGFEKLLNFILITVPISIIISQKFNTKDRNFFILVLLGVSAFLFLITIYSFSSISLSRSGVLGGGPIVLSRWLCLGSLILFFHPKLSKIKYLFVVLFIIMSLFTGSRGPFYSLFLVTILYFFINFRKVFWKTIIAISLISSLIIVSGIYTKLSEFNTVSRVFMNLKDGGTKKSTGRFIIYQTSFNEMVNYPMGIGSGNFDVYSDRRQHLLNKKIYHPHNLFLEIFIEFGLFSFILFCLYIFYSIRISYQKNIKSSNKYGNLLFYTFAFLMLNSMISGDLNDARLLLVFIPLMNLNSDVNNL